MATPLTEHEPAAPRKRSKQDGGRRAPTLDELRASRTVWCLMPSGHEFLIRPPNMELHLLGGGLPNTVRRLVTSTSNDLNRMLSGDDESANEAARDYFVYLVKSLVVEPDISHIATIEELDEALLPANFHFLLEIGQRERDTDALGRMLWGLPSLDRWATFREQHGCDPDCPSCLALQRRYSVAPVLG